MRHAYTRSNILLERWLLGRLGTWVPSRVCIGSNDSARFSCPTLICGILPRGQEPENAPEIPKDYPRGVGQPIGFTGGIGSRNAQEWLSRYKEAATAAGCRCQCDAQSSFRVGKTRTNPIDAAELEKLARVIYEWGGRDGKTPSRGPRHATSALRSRSAHRIVKKSARAEHFLVDLSSPLVSNVQWLLASEPWVPFLRFLSTDRRMVEIQGSPPAEPVGGSAPACPHSRRLTN